MAKKLEMKKGPADCYKSAKLSPTPPFAFIWSPLSSGIQVLRSPFWGSTFGPWPPSGCAVQVGRLWFGLGWKLGSLGITSPPAPLSILLPYQTQTPSLPFWGCLWPFLINHHVYYWGTYCQPHFVPLEYPLAFNFPQYMGHLVNIFCIQRAFTYL